MLGNVVDIDVIAALLAFAEQNDRFAAIGLAAEAVRAVAVVRIAGAVDAGSAAGWRAAIEPAMLASICSRARCIAPCRLVGAAGEASVSGSGPSA